MINNKKGTTVLKTMFFLEMMLLLCTRDTAAGKAHLGITFNGGEFSAQSAAYGSAASSRALQALAATNASHVQMHVSWYQANISTSDIAARNEPGSPLRTVSDQQLLKTIELAQQMGLKVLLSPVVDLDWDLPSENTPSAAGQLNQSGLGRWTRDPKAISRANIGQAMPFFDWGRWFASYNKFLLHYAKLAQVVGVVAFDVCAGLQSALNLQTNVVHWNQTVSMIRKVYSGDLLATASGEPTALKAVPLEIWELLDMIGVDATEVSLAPPAFSKMKPGEMPSPAFERVNVSIESVADAWLATLSAWEHLSTATGSAAPSIPFQRIRFVLCSNTLSENKHAIYA